MTKDTEFLYWKSNDNWYDFDEKAGEFYLTVQAPERAKRSFELWKDRYADEIEEIRIEYLKDFQAASLEGIRSGKNDDLPGIQ
ncbi:MAG: hypothetical protein HUJ54_12195 [Erysipelotrichaceae bacterium]|nr:hypothetical protein [Erysipelotrichaceae bacterium]